MNRWTEPLTIEDLKALQDDLMKARKRSDQGIILAPGEQVARVLWRLAQDALDGHTTYCDKCNTTTPDSWITEADDEQVCLFCAVEVSA
jgi:formylmethanofuran dehydrogenase subunit E